LEPDQFIRYPAKWFILMHESLYSENPNLIGFRDYNEWYPIEEGELVVYYQFKAMRLKGVYEVIEKRKNIVVSYGKPPCFDVGELCFQCRLDLLKKIDVSFTTDDFANLSFYKHLRNPVRFDNRRAFEIRNKDLQYILSLLTDM